MEKNKLTKMSGQPESIRAHGQLMNLKHLYIYAPVYLCACIPVIGGKMAPRFLRLEANVLRCSMGCSEIGF